VRLVRAYSTGMLFQTKVRLRWVHKTSCIEYLNIIPRISTNRTTLRLPPYEHSQLSNWQVHRVLRFYTRSVMVSLIVRANPQQLQTPCCPNIGQSLDSVRTNVPVEYALSRHLKAQYRLPTHRKMDFCPIKLGLFLNQS